MVTREYGMKRIKHVILAMTLSLAVMAIFFVKGFVVSGHSMEPTLHDGQYLLYTHITQANPGDLIVFTLDNEVLVKRVDFIEDHMYWVTADNQMNSMDSKDFGFIPEQNILGVVIR